MWDWVKRQWMNLLWALMAMDEPTAETYQGKWRYYFSRYESNDEN